MGLRYGIRDPRAGKNLFRIPDPGVKKAPDPGSGPQHCVSPFCVHFKLKITKNMTHRRDSKSSPRGDSRWAAGATYHPADPGATRPGDTSLGKLFVCFQTIKKFKTCIFCYDIKGLFLSLHSITVRQEQQCLHEFFN